MWNLFKIISESADRIGCSVYLVGGAVRDLLLQREPGDLDFAVSHHSEELTRQIANQLHGTLVMLDKKRETARLILPDYTLDFSLFKENNLEGDLRSRDFTINAMALPLMDNLKDNWQEQLLDPLGGYKDLQRGLLRVTSHSSILEDPLRSIRGIRLAAKYNLSILPETGVYLKQGCRHLDSVAGERIWQELSALLSTARSYQWIDFLDRELAFWHFLLAGRLRMQETRQNYYHVENVWYHSLRTYHCLELLLQELSLVHPAGEQIIKALEQDQKNHLGILKLAALVHDIGKPDTAFVHANGRISFHGHPAAGLPYIKALAQRLRLAKEESRLIENLVLYHMEPLELYKAKKRSDLTLYRFFRTLGTHTLDILLLSLADLTATYTAGERLSELAPYRQFIFNLLTKFTTETYKFNPTLWLNGSDLIALGIPFGPDIGIILERLAEAQIMGIVRDKNSALQWVKAGLYREE